MDKYLQNTIGTRPVRPRNLLQGEYPFSQRMRNSFRLDNNIEYELELYRWSIEQLYIDSEKELYERINKICGEWYIDYLDKNISDVIKFTNECKWFITPFLFQPPTYPKDCDTEWKRQVYLEIFKDWNPNFYVLEALKSINKTFGIK